MTNFHPSRDFPFPQKEEQTRVDLKAAVARFLLSCTVPLALLLFGGLGKHLIISEFRWENFFLGPDFALAGMAAGLLNFLDVPDSKDVVGIPMKIYWTVGYFVITFGIYMVLLVLHQNIEKRQIAADEQYDAAKHAAANANPPRPVPKRIEAGVRLGMIANFVGLGPSFLFTFLKLKGSL
jgi:hypothetical protein